MKKFVLAAILTLPPILALGVSGAAAPAPNVVVPDAVKWTAGTGSMKGAQVAVIDGNPMKAGEYAMRLKLPDGAKFAPHTHGNVEHVTVLSGTLMVGLGAKFDEAKMTALPAGSYVSVPKALAHYALAKGETIIQITGMGPSSMTMLK